MSFIVQIPEARDDNRRKKPAEMLQAAEIDRPGRIRGARAKRSALSPLQTNQTRVSRASGRAAPKVSVEPFVR